MATKKTGHHRRATCKECGKHRDIVGQISRGGYCTDCGYARLVEVHAQMHLKRGEWWDKFQAGVARHQEKRWRERAQELRGDDPE